jgi:hypothetical protein
VVNIFDVLEAVDIALGIGVHSDCQLTRTDLPNGIPPNCRAPDGVINIFDVLVIIDLALGREDCCSYYYAHIIKCTKDEDCDDGVDCTDDTCDPVNDCQYTPGDANCDDGVDCTDDTCDPVNDCQYTPGDANCDDGVDCTDDTCDPANDCQYTPSDANCDDGKFCNGEETCDPLAGCQPGTDPCPDLWCDEDADQCVELCELEIYQGGYPVPPLNTYNMPGRRGLALTCGDMVQFDYCTNCPLEIPPYQDPCPEWFMTVLSGTPPAGTQITDDPLIYPSAAFLTIGPDCTGMDAPAVLEITVTDPCNFNLTDSVTILVGEVTLDIGEVRTQPGTQGVAVEVSLDNPDHQVKAIQARIVDNGDYLTCTNCIADDDNAPEYNCIAQEQGDGDCVVVMSSNNPAAMIEQGSMRPVLSVEFDVSPDAQTNDCIDLWFYTGGTFIADKFGRALCPCLVSGEICFAVCGDVYPREDLPDRPNCGDGVVDIFDTLEEIDLVLDIVDPSDCQKDRADVPTGTLPYCADPDGDINLFDALVVTDMALGKANCCDYYYSGQIY